MKTYMFGLETVDLKYIALSKMLLFSINFPFFTLFYCMTMKHFESALCLKSAT